MYIYVHVCIYVAVEALSTHVFIEDPPSPGTVALPKRNDMWELSVTWLLKKERPRGTRPGGLPAEPQVEQTLAGSASSLGFG